MGGKLADVTQANQSLAELAAKQSEIRRQGATGKKVFSYAQDPAAARSITTSGITKQQTQQYNRSADLASSINNVNYTHHTHLHDGVLSRVNVILAKGSSEMSADNLAAYKEETDALIKEVLTILNEKTEGIYIHGGSKTESEPFTTTETDGKITAIAYEGSGNGREFRVGPGTNAKLSIFTSDTSNQKWATIGNKLIEVRDALEAKDSSKLQTLTKEFVEFEKDIASETAKISAQQLRIDTAKKLNEVSLQNEEASISREQDVDYSELSVELSRLMQAFMASIKGINGILDAPTLLSLR